MSRGFGFGRHPVGIEITDTDVKMCELRRSTKISPIVQYYETTALPAGAMNDGRIEDERLLAQGMRELLSRRRWSTANVHFAIPSQSVMVRILKVPNVHDKALRKIVDFEIKNNIHLPFNDPHYDFVKLQDDTAMASSNTCEILLAAASRSMLQQYSRIFDELGLHLRSMEIKAFSLQRLERISRSASDELTLLADVTRSNCDLTIVRGGGIAMTRNVPAVFAAQQAQHEHGVDRVFEDLLSAEVHDDSSFNELAGEMERLINFYRYTLNHRDAEFQRVVVSGDIPMIGELIRYLSGRMTMPVIGYAWDKLQIAGSSASWDLARYAAPLGLCLRGRRS